MVLEQDNSERNIPGIQEVELQHLGAQLLEYVMTYRMLIHIKTVDVEQKLDMLYDIGMKIRTRRYDLLFNDPSIVLPNTQNMSLEEYQRSLGESMIGGPF